MKSESNVPPAKIRCMWAKRESTAHLPWYTWVVVHGMVVLSLEKNCDSKNRVA